MGGQAVGTIRCRIGDFEPDRGSGNRFATMRKPIIHLHFWPESCYLGNKNRANRSGEKMEPTPAEDLNKPQVDLAQNEGSLTGGDEKMAGRLRAMIDALSDALVTIDDGGGITDFNKAAERIFGYRREELLGIPLSEVIILPSQRDARERGMAALVKTGWGNILGECLEVAALSKDNSETPVELTVTSIPGETPPIFNAIIHLITRRNGGDEKSRSHDEEYRLLFEANPMAMWVSDADTLGFLAINQAAIAQFGYSREEFLSHSLCDIRPADDLGQIEDVKGKLNGTDSSGEWRFLRKDGTLLVVSICSSPITFAGRSARLVVSTDVTQRQLAEEKIIQGEANLVLAQRVAQIGSWEVDLTNREDRTNHPPHWSEETFRIFGLDPATTKVTHDSFFHLLHPDERQLARETFIQQLRTGEPYRIDHRTIRPDGSERIVHIQSTTVRDAEGRLVKMAGTVQDLTERRQAERLLREQANLINLAPDATLVCNLDGAVRFWNHSAERLYGWTAADVVGKRITDFIEQDVERYHAAEKQLMEAGQWRGELNHLCKDGRAIVVDARWTLVRSERGEPESVLIIHADVTEKKKLEAQFLRSQRLESIGTLAAGVAHDLNNILAPILLGCPLLRTDMPEDDKEALLALVQASAERGANVVKQMLTFARGADGERILVQTSHLIEEVARIAEQTFPKEITIRTQCPRDLWMVEADPTQLRQVLLNLSVNARDAMPTGGVLKLSAENFQVDVHHAGMISGAQVGPHVLLQITDNGTGIPHQIIDKIFDPFFTTKEIGKGAGLGLSTVIGIVKGYGGFLDFYSELGYTGFKVFLPACNAVTAPVEHTDSLPVSSGRGQKILVVDDEPGVRTAAQRVLEGWGYQPLLAEDGVSALALYAQQPNGIDLVLTDLVMPVMDGLMLARALRKMNPKQKIILTTGLDEDLQSPEIRSLGLDACLRKPHSREKLLSTLEETLRSEPATLA